MPAWLKPGHRRLQHLHQSLIEQRNGEKGETAYRFVREGNVSAFYWIDQGLGFALSAATSRDRLLPIVEAVYHQVEGPERAFQ
jgi:anti-sigma factor RsiW